MISKKRIIAVALAGALLLSGVATASAVGGAAANDSLTVAVEDAANGATVSVTHDGSAVENASVTVEQANGSSYAGTGDYTTDENGTVTLPEPEENATVEITVSKNDTTGSTTATLIAADGGEDGGDEDGDENDAFGQMVSSFVQEMLNAGDDGGPIGQIVSDYVTSNNPGSDKKPDHAGRPAEAGESNSSAENGTDKRGTQGPPEDAGNGSDKKGNGKDKNDRKGGNEKKGGNGKDKDRGNGKPTTTSDG